MTEGDSIARQQMITLHATTGSVYFGHLLLGYAVTPITRSSYFMPHYAVKGGMDLH